MKQIPCLDSHCDSVSKCCYSGRHLFANDCHIALDRTGQFSRYVQLFALYWDTAIPPEVSCLHEYERMKRYFHAELAAHPDLAIHCKGKKDIDAAHQAGKAAAMLSIEDSSLLECDPAQLEMAAADGIQAIALTWNYRNAVSGTCAENPELGLTDQGRAFVREAERTGILMDVSHLSPKGFWDLFEMAERPIVATHSNSDAVLPHIRNLTDDQFRAIMESDGIVGLNYYAEFIGGTRDIPALIRHLEHFLELGGENHVGLGGDLDGCSEVCHGIDTLEGVPNLWQALEQRGYSEALLQKLFFDNWMKRLHD